MFHIAALVAVIGIMAGPPDAMADEHYVVTNGTPGVTPTPNYTTWDTAATNIQDAVEVASDSDLVWVTNGTYYCWSNSSVAGYTSMVTVTKNITIKSVNGPQATIVDANYPTFVNRCFYISNATVSGFTITNGHVRDVASGGGVFINSSGLVTNCWITGNVLTDGTVSAHCGGGGVYCLNGGEVVNCQIYGNIATNLYTYYGGTNGGAGVGGNNGGILRDCIISNNICFWGTTNGGIGKGAGYAVRFHGNGNLISNCTIINNQGGGIRVWTDDSAQTSIVDNCRIIGNNMHGVNDHYSGGMWLYAQYGYIIARNCQIINNSSGNRAGGVNVLTGGVVSNCLVSSNYSGTGGGGGGVTLCGNNAFARNCTIVSNSTANIGGGVYIRDGGAMRNCLVARNSASVGYGGGIMIYCANADQLGLVENCTVVNNSIGPGISCGIGANSGTKIVLNTIMYSNSPSDWATGDTHTFFTNCCAASTNGMLGSGNITDWPVFVDYDAKNYLLRLRSPCINAGLNQNWMTNTVDLDGNARILNNIVDIGAYETFLLQGVIYKFH